MPDVALGAVDNTHICNYMSFRQKSYDNVHNAPAEKQLISDGEDLGDPHRRPGPSHTSYTTRAPNHGYG